MGPEVVVSILKGLHLSHTGTELARLVIIVVALSLVGRKIRQRVYALQNLSVERRFGLPTQMKDEGGITVEVGNNAAGLIYLLKHTTDENELKQIKGRIRAMIRAGILNTRGRRALARLLEREVGSVERAPWLARQWNHTIHYFVLQCTAVAINLVSPLLTVLTLIHYIDYLIHNRRVRFDNPHYQMLVSAGKDFFKSFVGMWFISAEIGLVVDAGTAAGGHSFFGEFGGKYIQSFVELLEGSKDGKTASALSLGQQLIPQVINGQLVQQTIHEALGGTTDVQAWEHVVKPLRNTPRSRRFMNAPRNRVTTKTFAGVLQIADQLQGGFIEKGSIENAGLKWDDVVNILTQNGWAVQINPTVARLVIKPDEKREALSKAFGSDFEKILPILQKYQRVDVSLSRSSMP